MQNQRARTNYTYQHDSTTCNIVSITDDWTTSRKRVLHVLFQAVANPAASITITFVLPTVMAEFQSISPISTRIKKGIAYIYIYLKKYYK